MQHRVEQWPNRLGFDILELGTNEELAEVWLYKEGMGVRTETHVLKVPYEITRDPAVAYALCLEMGLSRDTLDDLDPREAEAIYQAHVPGQKEMHFDA